MGIVYRAADRLTGQDVALKQVISAVSDPTSSSESDRRELNLALAREFQTLASLRHPHIISVLDYGFETRQPNGPSAPEIIPYFTMSLLDNPQTLTEATHNAPLSVKVDLLIQTLQALAYLHRRGILHRDIKPGNLLVSQGEAKVVDFGLASEQAEIPEMVGTLAYMAPETLSGAASTPATDIYSFGIVAYELLMGAFPYNVSAGVSQLIYEILNAPLPRLRRSDVPQALMSVLEMLTAKVPAERYQDADAVIDALCEATNRPLPTETYAIRESFLQAAGFVGRQAESETLNTALQNALAGQGSTWLVGGESGVGKSRLLREIQTRALVSGALVLQGQAIAEGGLAFHLWRDPLRRLALATELSSIEAGVLKAVVPDIETLLNRPVPDLPTAEGDAERQRIFGTVCAMFERHKQPMVLILEDLHWAIESLELLKRLNVKAKHLPLLIIGSYRHDERANLPDQLPGMQVIGLQRLTESEVAALSTSMLGEGGRKEKVLDFLNRETEGNVFFLIEVIRALAEEAGSLSEIGRDSMPAKVMAGGIQQIVQRRLSRVPEWGRSFLDLVAVGGRELDTSVLQHAVNGDLRGHSLDVWLHQCAEVAVLEVQGHRWRFAHDKVREQVLADLSAQQSQALHRRIATGIEAAYPSPAERAERAILLAHHWKSAGDSAKEAHYAALAGDCLMGTGSAREALTFYERAAELMLLVHNDAMPVAEDSEANSTPGPSIQLKIGQAHKEVGNFNEARQTFEALIAQSNNPRDVASALHNLSFILAQLGEVAEAERIAGESLRHYEALGDSRGMSSAHQAIGSANFRYGDYRKADEHYQAALDLINTQDDQRFYAHLLLQQTQVFSQLGEYDRVQELVEQAMSVFEAVGDQRGILDCHNELGILYGRRGDSATSKQHYLKCYELARTLSLRSSMGIALVNLGIATKRLGEYAEAKSANALARSIFREIGLRYGEAVVVANLANVQEILNEDDAARLNLYEGLQIAYEAGGFNAVAHILNTFARLAQKIGQYDQSIEFALAAIQHPAADQTAKDRADELLDSIRAEISAQDFAAAESAARHVDAIIKQLLDEAASLE